jgi:hypothetical protein
MYTNYAGVCNQKGLIYGSVKKATEGVIKLGDKEFPDRRVDPVIADVYLFKGTIAYCDVKKCDFDPTTRCVAKWVTTDAQGSFRFEVEAGTYTLLLKVDDHFITPGYAQDGDVPPIIISGEQYIQHHIDLFV